MFVTPYSAESRILRHKLLSSDCLPRYQLIDVNVFVLKRPNYPCTQVIRSFLFYFSFYRKRISSHF